MRSWKKWVAVALATAIVGTGNLQAAATVYQLHVPIGVSEEEVILTFGDNVFEVNTNENGEVLVMTEKETGFLYVEVGQTLWKYQFNQGTVVGKEEIAPSILSFTGRTDLRPGEDLWLRVNAEAVVSSAELRYQWYKDGVPLVGKTSSVLNLKGVSVSDSGKYTVEVSQTGSSGVVTRSSEQVISVSDSEDSLKGSLCYNVGIGGTVTLENYSDKGEVTYSVVRELDMEKEGSSTDQPSEEQAEELTTIDCTLEGNQFTAKEEGIAVLTASDGNSQKTIHISCNKETWLVDGIETDFVYDGKQHPFAYVGSAGVKSCIPEYWREGENWTYEAPVAAGSYVCKLTITDEKNKSFCKFIPMTISRRKVSIFNPEVKTKEYDGTTEAEVTGTLVGTISGDKVNVAFPIAKFNKADAGERAVHAKGEVRLTGEDADNYRLEETSLADLSGTILKRTITVTALSKFSTEGEDPVTLTYTTSRNAGAVEGLQLKCSVTKDSAPGDYAIKIVAPKSKNFVYKCKNGIYTVLKSEVSSETEDRENGEFGTDSTVFDHYLTDPEDDYDWVEIRENLEKEQQEETEKQEEEGNEPEEVEKDEKSEKVLINLFDVSRGILLDGLYKLDNDSLEANKNVLVLKYWVSRTGTLTATDDVRIRAGKSGSWKKELDFTEGKKGNYLSAENFNFYAKCGDKVVRCRANKFICDREEPTINVEGIGLAELGVEAEDIHQNTPLSVDVKAVFGVSGRKTLSYKLVTAESAASLDEDREDGWKLISGNHITVDQEFRGQIAIRAEDMLGNKTVVYTEPFCIDTAAPTVEGVAFGGIYEDSVTYHVTDPSGVQSVLFDGKEADVTGTVLGGGVHTLIVSDTNGNSQSITFTCQDGNLINKVLHHFKSLQ